MLVPGPLRRWRASEAAALVDALNVAHGTNPPPCRLRGPGTFEWTCALAWILPPLTIGFALVPVLVVAAAVGRRLWFWVATAALWDLFVASLLLVLGPGTTSPLGAVLMLVTCVGASTVLIVGWLATRRTRRRHLPG